MARKRKTRNEAATYCRSYLVTLGLVSVALSVFILVHDGGDRHMALVGSVLLGAFLLGGSALVLFGLLGPSGKMQEWAEVTSRHEASLVIMALAYPVYLVLLPFHDRR